MVNDKEVRQGMTEEPQSYDDKHETNQMALQKPLTAN